MKSKIFPRVLLVIVTLIVLFGLNYVLTGRTDQHNDDFGTFWVGGHLLSQGLSPYDPTATANALASIGSTRTNEVFGALSYPLWTIFLFVPLSWLDVDMSAAIWLTLNEILIGLAFYLVGSALVTSLPKPEGTRIFSYLFSRGFLPFLLSVHFLRCLLDGQLSIITLTTAALFIWAAQRQNWPIAGLALLAVLFKPTTLTLFAVVAFLWLFVRKERRSGAYIFLAVALGLAAFGFLLDNHMLSDMYNTSTPAGKQLGFRNATVWGVCATVFRNLGGTNAEIWGWLVAAGLGILALFIGWNSFKAFPVGPVRDVTGWTLLFLFSLCFSWYAFSYEAVALLLPLLVVLRLIYDQSLKVRVGVGTGLLVVLWLVPLLMNFTPLNENRAGLFTLLMLAMVLLVMKRWPPRLKGADADHTIKESAPLAKTAAILVTQPESEMLT